MPAWVYVLAVAAVLFVAFVAVSHGHPFRKGAHAAPRALPVARVDLPAVGSMSLADEQTVRLPAPPWLPPAEPWLTAPLPGSWHPGQHVSVNGEIPAEPKRLGPYGGQLGPRAQLVWDRWDARCRERWGFSPS